MASSAAVPISTAIVRPTMTTVERDVPTGLAIGTLVLRHRESHRHPHPSAFLRRYLCLAAELHCKTTDQGQSETAAHARADRSAAAGAVVLDGELDGARLVGGLDADLRGAGAVEAAVEGAADGLGHDQPDRN